MVMKFDSKPSQDGVNRQNAPKKNEALSGFEENKKYKNKADRFNKTTAELKMLHDEYMSDKSLVGESGSSWVDQTQWYRKAMSGTPRGKFQEADELIEWYKNQRKKKDNEKKKDEVNVPPQPNEQTHMIFVDGDTSPEDGAFTPIPDKPSPVVEWDDIDNNIDDDSKNTQNTIPPTDAMTHMNFTDPQENPSSLRDSSVKKEFETPKPPRGVRTHMLFGPEDSLGDYDKKPKPGPVVPVPDPVPPIPDPVIPEPIPGPVIPTPEPKPSKRVTIEGKVTMVDVDAKEAMKQEARDVAEKELSVEKKAKQNIVKKIWKNNLFREFYRQRNISKAKKKIMETGSLYANDSEKEDVQDEAMQKVVERFSYEYDEMIHEGEERQIFKNENDPLVEETNKELKKAISKYINKEIDENSFEAEKERIFQYMFVRNNDDFKKLAEKRKNGKISEDEFVQRKGQIMSKSKHDIGELKQYHDNLQNIVEQVQMNVDQGIALENIDLDLQFIVGKAKLGVRQENKFGSVDKIMDKMERYSLGGVNEATVAIGLAIAHAAFVKGTTIGASWASKIAGMAIPGVVGGAVAGFRESRMLELERRQHAREIAKGGSVENLDERRREIEKHRFDSFEANVATNTINTDSARLEQFLNSDSLDQENLEEINRIAAELFENVAQNEALVKISDKENVDLLAYSGVENVEDERFENDLARARAKVNLRKLYEKGIYKIPGDKTFDEFLESTVLAQEIFIRKGDGKDDGMEQKNKAFRKMKVKKSIAAAAKATAWGVVAGFIAQEGFAFVQDGTTGALERVFRGDAAYENFGGSSTLINSVVEKISENINGTSDFSLGNSNFHLPDGFDMAENVNGEYFISRGGQELGPLTLDSNGHLDQDSVDLLKESGLVSEIKETIIKKVTESPVSVEDYVLNHQDEMTQIKHDPWYNNDTSAFDKNELRGDLGFNEDTGEYFFKIDRMVQGDSFVNGDVADLSGGKKLAMMIYLSENTQANAFQIEIDPETKMAIIPKGSEVEKLLSMGDNGKPVCLGRFAEAVELGDVTEDGRQIISSLATLEGAGVESIGGTVTEDVIVEDLTISYDQDIDLPYIIPIRGRRALEKVEKDMDMDPVYSPEDIQDILLKQDLEGGDKKDLDDAEGATKTLDTSDMNEMLALMSKAQISDKEALENRKNNKNNNSEMNEMLAIMADAQLGDDTEKESKKSDKETKEEKELREKKSFKEWSQKKEDYHRAMMRLFANRLNPKKAALYLAELFAIEKRLGKVKKSKFPLGQKEDFFKSSKNGGFGIANLHDPQYYREKHVWNLEKAIDKNSDQAQIAEDAGRSGLAESLGLKRKKLEKSLKATEKIFDRWFGELSTKERKDLREQFSGTVAKKKLKNRELEEEKKVKKKNKEDGQESKIDKEKDVENSGNNKGHDQNKNTDTGTLVWPPNRLNSRLSAARGETEVSRFGEGSRNKDFGHRRGGESVETVEVLEKGFPNPEIYGKEGIKNIREEYDGILKEIAGVKKNRGDTKDVVDLIKDLYEIDNNLKWAHEGGVLGVENVSDFYKPESEGGIGKSYINTPDYHQYRYVWDMENLLNNYEKQAVRSALVRKALEDSGLRSDYKNTKKLFEKELPKISRKRSVEISGKLKNRRKNKNKKLSNQELESYFLNEIDEYSKNIDVGDKKEVKVIPINGSKSGKGTSSDKEDLGGLLKKQK